ncbi:hypothetical protein CkaCkLH20_03265 [Colletotrichum karsti]|uniref:non-specific serine/threonine protein kinase n=1 Tax=Colletotrichum karsti TaxID=1095194 RepID=A0A9P6LNY0_9PEZI|nr:uncharacterized protein CkaCkLH20_03265 [Colletotrichum karsti]KAF9879032.1 hypothetical protein CkaCkLH20_03265 [Colletotrichum karsti]
MHHQFLPNHNRSNSTPVPGPLPAVVTIDADPNNLFPKEYGEFDGQPLELPDTFWLRGTSQVRRNGSHYVNHAHAVTGLRKKKSSSGSTIQRAMQKVAHVWGWKASAPHAAAIEAPPIPSDGDTIELQPPLDVRRVNTIERAAAAKIYLETYYKEVFGTGKTPREQRLMQFRHDLDQAMPPMTDYHKELEMGRFFQEETIYLRQQRVVKAQSCRTTWASWSTKPLQIERFGVPRYSYLDHLDTVQILGKGSFGVVKLVRERYGPQVYAMKVIRKSDMIRNCQEGHLQAERDFLVAASSSEWIVPLMFSFQDPVNLYLVMNYMPGGDFLGLLIRENILSESRTRFYIAEMILCVEEAHNLGCIHRDVKPDNFLIGADGHLKISDFGLAFDDHWSHDTSYYKWHRQIRWSELRWREPEWLPQITDFLDTQYFEEDEPISDWSESVDPGAEEELPDTSVIFKELRSVGFGDRHVKFVLDAIKQPYDSNRLKQIDRDIDEYSRLSSEGKQCMKELVRKYGQKERKRPRDKLLRDPETKDEVMRLRKQTAFLGYSWRKASHMHRQPVSAVFETDAYTMPQEGPVVGYDMRFQGMSNRVPPQGW